MNDDTLQERIERILAEHPIQPPTYAGDAPIAMKRKRTAARIAEDVAAEVRKGRAAALREAAGDIAWSAETLPHMTPHDAARGLVRRAERIEKED